MSLESDLQNLGLLPGEAKVYLAGASLGPARVQDIAERAGSSRTYTYEILKSLMKKGLAASITRTGVTFYEMASAEKLQNILAEKIASLKETEKKIKEFSHLLTPSAQNDGKLRIEIFHGREGLKTVISGGECDNQELLILGAFENFLRHFPAFCTQQASKGTKTRLLTDKTGFTLELKKTDAKEQRETRFLPDMMPLPTLVCIHSNKVAVVCFNSKDLDTLFIEDEGVAKTCKSVFELLWKLSEHKQ